jgi:hypothetical protein
MSVLGVLFDHIQQISSLVEIIGKLGRSPRGAAAIAALKPAADCSARFQSARRKLFYYSVSFVRCDLCVLACWTGCDLTS